MKIEGLFRHASTHAAGLVIGDRPLDQLVPLYRDSVADAGDAVQHEMGGRGRPVKFDFLGLKTLTVLHRAVSPWPARVDVDLAQLHDDEKTFEMLSAMTLSACSSESAGMRDVLKGLKPDRFEDIIAVVALYRPGPMENIKHYVARKRDRLSPTCTRR